MRNFFIFTSVFSILVFTGSCHKKPSAAVDATPAVRISGYFLGHNNWHSSIDQIDLTRITDLNIAFINPNEAGEFTIDDNLKKVIQAAKKNNVRTYMSIGGGSAPEYLGEMIQPEHRQAYINGLLKACEEFQFDGIDVDLENDLINAHYASFVSALGAELRSKKKLMTAALASWNGNKIADSTMSQYDFINIMSYDKTGPWRPDKPGQHSPYEMVPEDFNYFNKTRSVPAGKLLIGLPFYGYGFGEQVASSMRYREIITAYPGSEDKDEIRLDNGSMLYYNGRTTIRKKVEFALDNKVGGVMIWELKQDSPDDRSLLKLIHSLMNPN